MKINGQHVSQMKSPSEMTVGAGEVRFPAGFDARQDDCLFTWALQKAGMDRSAVIQMF